MPHPILTWIVLTWISTIGFLGAAVIILKGLQKKRWALIGIAAVYFAIGIGCFLAQKFVL